ncbi:hypothetical protein A3860_37470 [Niastella vici]|uniref:SEC-C motif-containing protein n=1 Tax=Niastella vici TaxID=1703345 RepID=A0A1V9FMG3_9BACT|nr:SEC-C metal-binding domain-containing protein [Niastella vici]OQP59528.1 hypothetical protein A3860_37470 [Niastella vici]
MMPNQNDPCPCGSGKQYKRCCGNKANRKSSNPFGKYNTIDILQTIAALTLEEENHGKNLRLEESALEAARQPNQSKKNIPFEELRGYLQEEYELNPQEDPPANLFTEVVAFEGGDHLILPGIIQSPAFILNQLLSGIYHWRGVPLSEQFTTNCYHYVKAILLLSDHMIRKAGLPRYLQGVKRGKFISFPNNGKLNKFKKAVFFSHEEIQVLFDEAAVDIQALNPFLAVLTNPAFQQAGLVESPFVKQPILKLQDGYLVVSPATLTFALIKVLQSEAEAIGCVDDVHKVYHAITWNSTKKGLQVMGFKMVDVPEVPFPVHPGVETGYYQIDDDKIAAVQYVAMSRPKNGFNLKTFEAERSKMMADLAALPQFAGYKFMSVCIPSAMGNDLMMPLSAINQCQTLLVNSFEFDALAQTRRIKAIDLWNYTVAREKQIPEPFKFSMLSFLDEFTIYREHEDSFYLSDEGFDIGVWQYGRSQSFIASARQAEDAHCMAMRKTDGRIAKTFVIRKDKYAPIYLSTDDMRAGEICYGVEGFTPSVWVEAIKEVEKPDPKELTLYIEFTDAISYWLWQIKDDIDPYLAQIDPDCIQFTFALNDLKAFTELNDFYQRDSEVLAKIQITANGDTVHLVLPKELLSYFYGADNEGDRILVKALLTGINLLRVQKNLAPILDAEMDQIVEKNAPLGRKKKLFVHHTSHNWIIDNNGLGKPRFIQKYNTSEVANSIVGLLGQHCPPPGEVTDPALKKRLPIDIVIKGLLPHLKQVISQYDNESLLIRLLMLNESLVQHREMYRIKTPTRIACFVGQKQHIIDTMDRMADSSRTTTAVRCLIEHLAAEPATGNKMVSNTAIDELVAIMDAIISWGSLGDQLTYELFDIRVGVLRTGRIGTEKTVSRKIFDPFYLEKVKENVQDAEKAFEHEFPVASSQQGNAAGLPTAVDTAFRAEFGITLTRVFDFLYFIAALGLKQATGYAMMDLKTLKNQATNPPEPFTDEEFNNAIEFLSLRNRGKVEKFPKGYEPYDISPWRMSRRLSLMRKPLILVDTPDKANPIVFWGARQALVCADNIKIQCETDRLRVPDGGPVKKALATFVNAKSAGLVKSVLQQLKITGAIIDSEVFISPHGNLKNEEDIGDIDVLLIDPASREIYSLELKSFAPSRTVNEMIQECEKLFSSLSEKGLIEKHEIRHKWIENNLDKMGKLYNIDLTDFNVKSVFVTKESMIFPFLKQAGVSMPFITLYHLEKEGYECLKKL